MPRNQDEFERVALPHTRGLLGFARRLTGNSGAAEDLVQDSLLLAWRNFHQLEAGTNARAWLYRILLHAWYGVRRKVKRSPASDVRPVAASSAHGALEINQALDQLPVEQRTMITLAVVEGFTCRECADILGVPIGTVMSRLSRARQSLRDKLGAEREVAITAGRKESR